MISPDVFIPLMEKTGFIIEAGHYLITEVVTQLEKWKQLGYKDITVSLNVSMREIDAPDYVEFLSRQLRSHFVEAHRVNVEITESMAMSNAEKMLSALERLHASGVPISLDDFGTGYTSFSYLTQMPASSLKIDKSFIDNFQEESRNQQVVRAIIEMGHALGMSIVAEGIESQEVATMLHDFGVDKLQGYFFYKPLPVFELQSLISNGTTPPEEGGLPLHTLR
jgi:EAL domain-containing protein (putative c-di-GMP-specific phosphodiesterase class I)